MGSPLIKELPGASPDCNQMCSGSESLAAQDKQTTKSFKIHSLKPTTNLNFQLALNQTAVLQWSYVGKLYFYSLHTSATLGKSLGHFIMKRYLLGLPSGIVLWTFLQMKWFTLWAWAARWMVVIFTEMENREGGGSPNCSFECAAYEISVRNSSGGN